MSWTEPTDNSSAHRRAGGRRRYNAGRQARARARRQAIAWLLAAGIHPAEIARRLGCHRSTVARALAGEPWRALLETARMIDEFNRILGEPGYLARQAAALKARVIKEQVTHFTGGNQ